MGIAVFLLEPARATVAPATKKKNIMRNILYAFVFVGILGFAACGSSAEERVDENQEEMEDRAEERTDEMEDAAEDTDTTAVIQ